MATKTPAYTAATLPDAETLYGNLLAAVRHAIEHLPPELMHLIGIHSGGAWLAQRLHKDLGLAQPMGTLDISFYRDDFEKIGLHSQVMPSEISFSVAGKHLVLVDDVLYTGRTIRAAMNELFDYGRPASIRLAVLIDRGGRELPIAAVAVGGFIDPAPVASFVLSQTQAGAFVLTIESKEH
jgi:pyrimidine operon attenuation protein/uracil phosphoribosyltransferase